MLLTNKHKVITTFLHIGNEERALESIKVFGINITEVTIIKVRKLEESQSILKKPSGLPRGSSP
jgi:precorrin-6B methylase 2